ncbi:MAG: hypothetical protein ACK5TK_13005 [Betaproteobacteria bacterium]
MKRKQIALFVAGCFTAGTALAATQGQLGNTSTANFSLTVQAPVIPRQVQVLNVSDISFNNSSRSERDSSRPGATMAFCVVDTNGGSVNLSITNSYADGTFAWTAQTPEGENIQFQIDLTDFAVVNLWGSILGTTYLATVPTTFVSSTAGACGAGNIKIHPRLYISDMPQTFPAKTYSTTMTIVASPN